MTELDPERVAPVDVYRIINARVNEAGDLPRDTITSACKEIAAILGARAMQAAGAGVPLTGEMIACVNHLIARGEALVGWMRLDESEAISDSRRWFEATNKAWRLFPSRVPALSPAGPQEDQQPSGAITVSAEGFDKLVAAIENPKPPTEALRKLMSAPAPAADVAGLVEPEMVASTTYLPVLIENLLAIENPTPRIPNVARLLLKRSLARIKALQAEGAAVSKAIGSVRFMDPPDGGDVSLAEQVARMSAALTAAEAEAAALRAEVKRKDKAAKDFNAGYVLACANLVHTHGSPEMAADVMAQAGITWAEITRMDLGDYDMDALRKIKRETSRAPFIRSALGKGESPADTKAGG